MHLFFLNVLLMNEIHLHKYECSLSHIPVVVFEFVLALSFENFIIFIIF